MKIVVIGPVYPFKGGISHYTALMTRSLSKEHIVKNISFKMQYPKLLYKNEQRDYENDSFKIDNTEYLINTINPLSWIKTACFIKKENPDAVIFQWWHPWFSPCYIWLGKALKTHTKIIFACHNILPHEGFPLKRKLTKSVLKNGSAFIVHSQQDANDLCELIKEPHYIKTVLPTFNAFKLTDITKHEARKRLNIGAASEMMLFFGFIREYKGLKQLIKSMPAIHQSRPNAVLYIVGDFFGSSEKEEYVKLIAKCGCEKYIVLVDGYVPDKEVEPYFAACDVVVLPYISATQSGIVQIAYSFNKPVIATKVGGLPEVVQDGKTGFLVPPDNEEKLAEAVVSFFAENKADVFSQGIKAEAYRYEWARMNEIIDKLLKE